MLAVADPELDQGPRTNRSATVRMCAVSRDVRPIDELIRFVVAPSGEVIPDLKRKLPGRGLWVSAARSAVAEAVRRHHFTRGFKREVRVAATLASDTEALLARSAAEALAIAAKAGQVIAGFAKVADALERLGQNPVRALVHASDGAADGIRKLDALARQNRMNDGKPAEILIVNVLTSAQLDLALGRSNVVHAALLAGRATETVMARWRALARVRVPEPDRADAS